MRRSVLVALILCGLLQMAALARAATTTPSSLVLTSRDVSLVYGPGLAQFAQETVSNEQIGTLSATPTLTISVYRREGRLTGYAVAFRQSARQSAVSYVFCEVDVYRSAAGPVWRLNYARAHPGTIQAGFIVRPIHEGTVGSGGYYATFSGRPAGSATPKIHGATLSFRQGPYLATITVSSATPLSSNRVYRLGDIVDARLRRAR